MTPTSSRRRRSERAAIWSTAVKSDSAAPRAGEDAARRYASRPRPAESELTRAARLSTLGQMTASISHELKQPLSAILTNAETSLRVLATDSPNLPKVIQLSERIAASAQRAADIIERIQDMAEKRPPQLVSLDINEVVREALAFVRHESEEQSIRLHLDMAADLPPVTGDRIQLQQVLVNLLVNSGQALAAVAPERRDISIVTFRHGADGVGFSVRDTGPGIPDGDLERVFTGSFSTKAGGMGIGLTICRWIVAAHGGTITASIPQGGGAEFKVIIPRRSSGA